MRHVLILDHSVHFPDLAPTYASGPNPAYGVAAEGSVTVGTVVAQPLLVVSGHLRSAWLRYFAAARRSSV
jgi:hypothetical protein